MLGSLGVPLRIVESTAACSYVPKRTYAKRRARSPRHCKRVNKKWLKRYGLRAEPTAYTMEVLGACVLVVHPLLAPQYRAAINRTFKPAGPANYLGENRL